MHISKIKITNFRLLVDVELALEDETTLIVGRNNSGKTSLSEIIRRFLEDQSPKFQIEDFSSASYGRFCDAFHAKNAGEEEDAVRALIPSIELRIYLRYDAVQPYFDTLSDFIIDLDPNCIEALAIARYELRDGNIEALFEGMPIKELSDETRIIFFRALRERIPRLFTATVWAEDPNDSTNRKQMSHNALRALLKTGFVNAQRGLDDNTTRETDVLARIVEGLFNSATSPTSALEDQQVAQALQEAVQEIQEKIDTNFNNKLKNLIPTLSTFGYPGLGGPELATETTLDAKKLLSNHTKVRYAGQDGILFPESYNGLGVRNLIFILLQIINFYRKFRAEPDATGAYLVFIEEPEAHLHPQMQEVFIRQLSKIAQQLNEQEGVDRPWPVQFVVSTHSSHVANAAGFEAIRYFLPTSSTEIPAACRTKIKDLRMGLRTTPEEHRNFLHQYLTLTRCDLFFADKAVLIEGTSERLLLPVIIKKMEEAAPDSPKLSNQYVSIMEVGGAYAHIFFDLLDFLELRTLIITDMDSVTAAGGTACPVHQGQATSNACINTWFHDGELSPAALLAKTEAERIKGTKRISFQRPEAGDCPCGRTFEDAFMLANREMFNIGGNSAADKALDAWKKAKGIKKSEFALRHAINETAWVAPGYILDGLRWLAIFDPPVVCSVAEVMGATMVVQAEHGDVNG